MRNNLRSKRGMALIMALFFVAIAVAILGGLSARLMAQRNHVGHYVTYRECFNGLEAAYATAKHELENGGDGYVGVNDWNPTEDGTWPAFDTTAVAPLNLATEEDVQYFAVAQDWSDDGIDNTGDGQIDEFEEYGMYTVYAAARNGESVRQVEAVLNSANVNVWENAIFAGAGHIDAAMKGNVSIHGSVHILGNHILDGGEAVTVLDMMGASLIHNNYSKGPGQTITARQLASVPPLPQVLVNGELSDTLNAKLRVKRGLVSLNSAAEVGEANLAGNAQKEFMDGTYVNDGWTGTRVTADGGRGDPTVVYSDNGWDELYDLGDQVPFPELNDDWRWPENVQCYELGTEWMGTPGGKEVSPDGDFYTHEEFFNDVLSDGAPYTGNVEFMRGGANVYINLTRPSDANVAHRVKPDPVNCVKGDDYLYFNGANNVLEMNGQVTINGSLKFTGPSGNSNKISYYTGKGALLVNGSVLIDGDLMSCNDGNPNDYIRSFPERNCLGVMCTGDLTLGDKCAQMNIMGAFYALDTIKTAKQTRICGTFVSTYFDMGSQVPDIFQVPALPHHLPLGMIGNFPLLAMFQISWRELGVDL